MPAIGAREEGDSAFKLSSILERFGDLNTGQMNLGDEIGFFTIRVDFESGNGLGNGGREAVALVTKEFADGGGGVVQCLRQGKRSVHRRWKDGESGRWFWFGEKVMWLDHD